MLETDGSPALWTQLCTQHSITGKHSRWMMDPYSTHSNGADRTAGDLITYR